MKGKGADGRCYFRKEFGEKKKEMGLRLGKKYNGSARTGQEKKTVGKVSWAQGKNVPHWGVWTRELFSQKEQGCVKKECDGETTFG